MRCVFNRFLKHNILMAIFFRGIKLLVVSCRRPLHVLVTVEKGTIKNCSSVAILTLQAKNGSQESLWTLSVNPHT